MYKLKRKGCPPTKIPTYTGHTWECPEEVMELYTLGDGTKCCRAAPKGRKPKKQIVKEPTRNAAKQIVRSQQQVVRSQQQVVRSQQQVVRSQQQVVRPKKDIAYQAKGALAEVREKPDDPTKILNPRTGRWVKKDGKIGKEILAGFYQ